MKKQIRRLSPHQNGKVAAILMAIASLVMFLPMALIMAMVGPQVDEHGNDITLPTAFFAAMPVLYAVFGYISTAIGCALYNFMFRYIGGFEFEVAESGNASADPEPY